MPEKNQDFGLFEQMRFPDNQLILFSAESGKFLAGEAAYSLFQNLSQPVLLVDMGGNVADANAAACQFLEMYYGNLIHRPIQEFCRPAKDVSNEALNFSPREFQQGRLEVYRSDATFRLATFFWVPCVGSNWHLLILQSAEENELLAWQAATISPQVSFASTCLALDNPQAQLHLQSVALNACADVILITDREGRIEWVNPAFTELTGYTPAEAIGHNPRELVNSGHQDQAFFERLWQTILSGHVWRGELVNRRKDNTRYVEAMTITPVYDGESKIQHFIAIKQDITARKQAELDQQALSHQVATYAAALEAANKTLRLSEQRYRGLVESQVDLICRFQPEGILTFVNDAYCAFFGRSREDLIGHSFFKFIPESCQALIISRIEELQYLTVDQPIAVWEQPSYATNGHLVWHYWSNQAIFDEQGQLLEFQGIGRDITALKAAQAELLERERQLDLFFTQSLDGFFFMMLDEPIQWDDTVDKAATLEYVFAHQRITKANQAILDQYGLTESAFLGLTPADFFSHDIAAGKVVWRQLFDSGRQHINTEERKADGTVIWIEGDYICLFDEQGRITGHFGIQREVTGLKEAIAALERSESNYRMLVENQTDLVVKVDVDGQFLFVSPSYCELFGRTSEELLGGDFMPLVHEADRAATQEAMTALWQPPHRCRLEQRALTRHGWRWLSWSDTAIVDDGGNVTAIVGVGRDITERKQVELELQRSEQRFRNVLENLKLVAVMIDRHGQITFCNDYFLALTGWQRAEAIHQNWVTNFIPPEQQQEIDNLIGQAQSRQAFPSYYENEIVTRQGDRRLIAWNNTVQRDAEGHTVSITSIGEDITERKRYENSIYELTQRLSLATDVAKIGIWEWDMAKDTLIWDHQMYEIYGLTPETFGSNYESWLSRLHPEDVSVLQNETTAIARGDTEIHHEYRIIRLDGAIRHIENHAVIIRDERGLAQRMLGANWDITNRKRSEATLQETTHRLTLATQSARLGVWDWDVERDRLTWDDRIHEIYGIPKGQFFGAYAEWQARVHPDDWPAVEHQIRQLLTAAQIYDLEFRIIRPDGAIRHIESYASILRNELGQPVRVIGVNRDVSDRKQAELELAETHQQLQALMQNSPAVIALFDETGRYHQVNAITSAMLGRPAAEIVGQKFEDVFPPEVAARCMDRIRQIVVTDESLVVEDRLVMLGQERIFRSVLFPVLTKPGSPKLLGSVATDITPLVTAQENTRRQAERERLIREVTTKIRRSLDLNVILESTVQEVQQFLATDRVIIYRFNPDWSGDVIVESVGYGWTATINSTLHDPCFKGAIVERYLHGYVTQIDNVQTAHIQPCHKEFLAQFEIQANLVLPLVIEGSLWGLLCIHHCQAPRDWQSEEVGLTKQIADQVEIAIHQAQLLQEMALRAQRERLRGLITQHIRRSLDLDAILDTTVHEIRKFLKGDRVIIYQLNAEGSGQVIVESVEPGWTEMQGCILKDTCFTGKLLEKYRNGFIARIDSVETVPLSECYRGFLAQFEIQATLILPLVIESKLWGLLCVHHCSRPHGWKDDEVSFVRQICDQVEIAVQQAQLLKQSTLRAQRERLLNEIVTTARESLDLQEMMDRTAEKLREAFQVSRCIISLCAETDDHLECSAAAAGPGMKALRHQRLPIKGNALAEYLLSQPQPIAQEDLFNPPTAAPPLIEETTLALARQHNIVSALVISIRYQGQVKGLLAVHHNQPRPWTEDDCLLIQQVADQLAIAIHQAELYQQAQQEIAERMRLEEQLRHDAFHDALTGLPNRALFLDRLQFALQRFQRWQRQQELMLLANPLSGETVGIPRDQFAVLFMDLDRFKVINDSLGHSFGDQLLNLVAARLKNCLREVDMAARLGGDEFVILLEELTDTQLAIGVARRIHNLLEVPIFLDNREVFIRASIGIAFGSTNYSEPIQILRDADIAMYQAKQSGQEFVVFDASMHAIALQQMNLENDLRHAIKRGEFRLYYQPVISLATGTIDSFEALVRWQHPTRGLLYPGAFVEVAEETGLIAAIDLWVLQEACQQLHRWHTQFPQWANLSIGVNLSGKQFSQPDLISQIDYALATANLNGKHLKLEITESVLIENNDLAIQTLDAFRARNIQVCMDDFGTGYSSLSYLHRFPVDILKIDKSFILNLSSQKANSRDYEIVKAIINLALNLNLQVVAEGIENRDVLVYLQKNKCQFGQGYFFSPAVDRDQATQLLLSQPFH